MDSIFLLDSSGHIVIEPVAVHLVAEFEDLTEDQIRYLVLAYDFAHTVFKQQPQSNWRKLACEYVFKHRDPEKAEKDISTMAIKMFKALVYDEDREQKVKLVRRKRELQNEILTVQGAVKMKAIIESVTMIDRLIADIEQKIAFSDEEIILANKNAKLSMIEKYQRKLKLLQQ
jgi:23S rRNA-/tRNA-specific pseudouridylate synthase